MVNPVLRTRGCCGFVGGGRKSGLICYVSRLGRRKISEPATARHVCFIAVTEEVVRGRGMANVLIQTQEWEMTEKLDRQEEKGSSDAYGDCRDAAQSVTHLDVLACVVAS